MKKIIILVLVQLLSIYCRAYDFCEDGIYYNILSTSEMTIEVTYKDNVLLGSYSGSITIPEIVNHNNESYTVTCIGYRAFSFCNRMTSINIPNTITQIKQYAFSSSGINNIIIPSSVVSIGSKAFDGCYSLTQLTIENSNETLEFEAGGNSYYYEFENCPLSEVYIGRNIAYSSVSPFFRMSSIEKVLFGNGITTLNSKLFLGCGNIKYIRIPQNITSIETGVFSGCSSLKVVEFEDGDNPISFISSTNSPQFDGCSIDSVYLGRNISGEARWVFLRAFVSSVMVGEYVEAIPFSLFSGRGVQYVYLSKNIQNIQEYSFAYNSIKDVYCYAEIVPSTNSSAFENSNIEYATLHVPAKSVNAYKTAKPWKNFKNIVKINMPEHTLTYMVDGDVYKAYEIEEGENITPETTPTKEGYTFGGWSEIPETMPAHDLTVTGSFTINKYKLNYIVDGEEYKSYETEYGSTITPETDPTKEGYTFSGWSEIPETMPAHDVTVTGLFTVNKYHVTYIFDGDTFKTEYVDYASKITPPSVPEREGYSFAWNEYPETMPAYDITITGQYTINSYKLFYVVDGVEYKSYDVVYNTSITPEADPTNEGYTFSGWSEIPETMPAHDVTVAGSFSINSYKLTYMLNNEVYKEMTYEYGATVTPEPQPEGDYASFEWIDLPQTMPAHDVVVYAMYTSGITDVLMKTQQNVRIYTPNGKKLNKPQKGLNIVVLKDGTVKKIVVK